MAAPCVEEEDEVVYGAVSNIPREFHSRDLRNYFSQFLEVGGFDCFHFKHRPERKTERESKVESTTRPTTSASASGNARTACTDEDISTAMTMMTGTARDKTTNLTNGSDKEDEEACPKQTGNQRTKSTKKGYAWKRQERQKETFSTLCCVIRLHESNMNKLMKMYGKKNWVDSNGSAMPELCQISRVKVIANDTDHVEVVDLADKEPSNSHFLQRGKKLEAVTISASMLRSHLMGFPELNPPDIMPNGNVGTPTSVFSELIRECRLPPKVIKRLGIVFPKSRTNKRYGNVAFDYGGEVASVGEEEEEVVATASGHTIQSPGKRMIRTKNKKIRSKQGDHNQGNSPPESEEDEDSGEEWERHEALHNDVTNQERTTERLFESEMEVTWDKGSSGLVFYTDAAFWDKQEGDFDEKTADDWDVDMSAYYDPGGGDKDARDFIRMRRLEQMKQGLESTSVFTSKLPTKKERREKKRLERQQRKEAMKRQAQENQDAGIGHFEKHTKGFGRKLMEAQGWVEGQGLGKASKGISEALRNEGQNAFDKRGFGYLGKKLNPNQRSQGKSKQQQSGERKVIISTIYDDPEVTDPTEPLLRSQGPYHLKYRDEVQFTKASEKDVGNVR